jgi:hypothetical protein
MAEWSIAPVLKTGDPQGSVGSNPTPSARLIMNDLEFAFKDVKSDTSSDAEGHRYLATNLVGRVDEGRQIR